MAADQDSDQDDFKSNDELFGEIVEHQKDKLTNQQEKYKYELEQNQRRLNEYEQNIRELQEKLDAIDEKTSANILRYDEQGEEIDKKEREKLLRLHQRLRDSTIDSVYGDSPEDTLRRTLVATHNDKVRIEEQNKRLLKDLHEATQMVASMKKGSRSGDKANETRLNEETAESIYAESKKLNDKIEELHQTIESLQKQLEEKETENQETANETVDLEEVEVQIDHPHPTSGRSSTHRMLCRTKCVVVQNNFVNRLIFRIPNQFLI